MKPLASLIEDHRAAYAAFSEAVNRREKAETADTERAWPATDKAERKAALGMRVSLPNARGS